MRSILVDQSKLRYLGESSTITRRMRRINLPRLSLLSSTLTVIKGSFPFSFFISFHVRAYFPRDMSACCAWHAASLRVVNFKRTRTARENPLVRHRPPPSPPQCRTSSWINRQGKCINCARLTLMATRTFPANAAGNFTGMCVYVREVGEGGIYVYMHTYHVHLCAFV